MIIQGAPVKPEISFSRIQGAGLKLQSTKCRFLQTKVKYVYLGHIISGEGVAANPAKVENVASWPTPSSTRAVQLFLGLASYSLYYRWFITGFAEIARPLHRLSE